jgi:hypothetical protein
MKRNGDQSTNAEIVDGPNAISRRALFVGAGAAAGLGTIGLAFTAPSPAEAQKTSWDYEADVVVCGGGAAGLACAIRARDAGNHVIVVEGNFDLGGKMLHSGGAVSLGGGDPLQLRDIAGARDQEGYVTVPPHHKPKELDDDPDRLFTDLTDWSVMDPAAQAPYRYNERELMRAFADNAPNVRKLLMDNYVRFGRISGSTPNSGLSRGRQASPFMKLGDKTDIKFGTISREDAGKEMVRASHFSPVAMYSSELTAGPGTVGNGAALARPLEFSAREKGVQFLLNRHLDDLIREQPFNGRVLGIRASYSPRFDPDTGEQLQSLWSSGNINERRDTIVIRAHKGVMIATGGHSGNPQFRSMFYPAMRDPTYPGSTLAVLGPRGQDASGIIAGMKVGASLAGMQQNLGIPISFHIPNRLATRDAYSGELPGHPTFSYRKSTGIAVGSSSFEHVVAVNQVGKRFFNELNLTKQTQFSWYPGGPAAGVPNIGIDHKPRDWRNCDPSWVRQIYNKYPGTDAALQINEGSVAPDYFTGMLWAIFDQSSLDRAGWDIGAPFTDPKNGYFFSADTIEELAERIHAGNEYQRVPLKYLADTVKKWNAAVDAGKDSEFGRGEDAPMHRIDTPKFYAASIMVVWHDSYGGLRINGKSQVVDLQGNVIPGLYAGGEASGGTNQHGLGRAHVAGYIAGTNIHQESTGAAASTSRRLR